MALPKSQPGGTRPTARARDRQVPDGLWSVVGLAVIALSLPLAVSLLSSGELMHVCPGRTPRNLPLDQRNWQLFSGGAVYLAACGWAVIACAGALLVFRPLRLWARWPALLGTILVGLALWRVCHS